jgi:hypothetical protein
MRRPAGWLVTSAREAPGNTAPRHYERDLRMQQCEIEGHRSCATSRDFAKAGSDANKPPRWSAERRASPGAQTVKANLRGDARASDLALRAYDTGPLTGAAAPERLSALRPLTLCERENGKARRMFCLARTMTRAQMS